jgi:hypothetical protein
MDAQVKGQRAKAKGEILIGNTQFPKMAKEVCSLSSF